MDIEFHRLPDGYCAQAVRDDGATVHVPGFDRKFDTPHDVAHYAAEHGFRVAGGFWGSVAAGAMFGGMRVAHGRRRPHAAERSRRIITANATELGLAEGLAGAVHRARRDGLTPEAAATRLAGYWAESHAGPCPYDAVGMAHACALLGELADRWRRVPVGGRLTVSWDLPPVAPAVDLHDRRRPDRTHR